MDKIREIGERIRKDLKNICTVGLAIIIYMGLVNRIFGAICPMLIITGIPCPGCGMSRAMFYLVTGQVSESIQMHPMGIVVMCLFLYFVWNHYIIGRNAKGMMLLIGITLVLLIFIYIWRMYLYFPDRPPYVYHEDNLLERTFPYYKQILHDLGIL